MGRKKNGAPPPSEDVRVFCVLPDPSVNPYAKEIEQKTKAESKPETVSFSGLFAHADSLDRVLIFFGLLCAVGHGVLMPIQTIFLGDIIDVFGTSLSDPVAGVRSIALKLVWCGIAAGIASFVQTSALNMAGERQAHRLRARYFSAALRQEMGWHDFHLSGEHTARLAGDMQLIQEALGDKLGTLVQFLSQFFSGFAIAIWAGWRMGLVMLASTPLFVMSGGMAGMLTAVFTAKAQAAYAQAGAVAEEAISCVRTVAAFGGEKREARRYADKLLPSLQTGVKLGTVTGVALACMFFFMIAMYSLAFWYGAREVIHGRMTPGEVINVFLAVLMAASSVGTMMTPLSAVAAGRGAAKHVFDTIARQSLIDSAVSTGIVPPSPALGDVSFDGVHFAYPSRPDQPVLQSLTLRIPRGKTVAVVGTSGCGKSTLVGLLERFYSPLVGEVTLDGRDIASLNLTWLRKQIGIVSQEPVLFSGSIAENIALGRPGEPIAIDLIHAAARTANAHDFIMSLPQGYDTLVGERGAQLSGGQKQRIAIARALIRDPAVLVLDEATSALDTESERIVQEALDKASKKRTTIVVAHRLSTVRRADTIAVLGGGKVVELGSHDELMALGGAYHALVMRQGIADVDPKTPTPPVTHTEAVAEVIPAASLGPAMEEGIALTTATEVGDVEKIDDESKAEKWPLLRTLMMCSGKWHLIILGLLGCAANGAFFPLFTLIFSEVTDALVRKTGDDLRRESERYAVYFVLLAIAVASTAFFMIAMFKQAGEHLTYRLRNALFASMLRQEPGWFDDREHRPGVLTTRLSKDAQAVQALAGATVGNVVQIIATLVTGLAIALSASWKLALVVLACVPLTSLGIVLEMSTQFGGAGTGAKARRAYEQSGSVASEALESVRTVAALGLESTFGSRYAELLRKPHRAGLRSSNILALGLGSAELAVFLTYALAYWYGSKLVGAGEISFSHMMKAIMGVTYGATLLGHITSSSPAFGRARLAAVASFDLMDRLPPIDANASANPTDPPLPNKVDGDIKFCDVKFRYPTRPDVTVLRHLSLHLHAGSTMALVGPSGSGKSTVVGLVERFYDPKQGSVELDGRDLRTLPAAWLRSQIGYVGQEPILFATTIRENIAYGIPEGSPAPTEDQIVAAAKLANAHRFISALPKGYDTPVGEKGAQLSGGQKQRIAIARALIRNPRILVLDEATSALDAESERVVQEALDRARTGRTTIVIAHRLSTVRDADAIAVMNRGSVAELGTHSDLMAKRGLYYALATQQIE